MNPWRSRLLVCIVLWLAVQGHSMATESTANTPMGMLLFHGSAALVDLMLLYCVSQILAGRTCEDMQTLFLVSIVLNFLGWLAYLAYAPPIYYNVFMWGLTYAQWARILLGDYDDYVAHLLGVNLVRRDDLHRPKLYAKKAQ